MKKKDDEPVLLNEEWDTDASASDNESFEIEMMLDESVKTKERKETY
ncbi:hypothetical protein [Bacillus sp. FJAT-47783]|nr:hypothetical protein [Bacillus sp. FJAT-47783]